MALAPRKEQNDLQMMEIRNNITYQTL